jgi:hypothetical protein
MEIKLCTPVAEPPIEDAACWHPTSDRDREHIAMTFIETMDRLVMDHSFHPAEVLAEILEVAHGEATHLVEVHADARDVAAWAGNVRTALSSLDRDVPRRIVRTWALRGDGT